jgi:predicted nucleotidyltransferase
MRVPSRPQSNFRYPLSRILSSEGAVRVLRELMRHGGEVAIPRLAEATKLNQQTVRNVLHGDLTMTGIVEMVGQGRSTLYRARTTYPLYPQLDELFAQEEARVQRTFQTLAAIAREAAPDLLALWVFGSVARVEDEPGSDLDIALVVPDEISADAAASDLRERVAPLLDPERVTVSVVGLSADDVLRLAADETPWWRNVSAEAQPVLGLPPTALFEHLRTSRNKGGTQAA